MFSRKSVTVYRSKHDDLMDDYHVQHPLLDLAELMGTLSIFGCLGYLAFRVFFF